MREQSRIRCENAGGLFGRHPTAFYKRVSLSTRKPWRPTLAIRGGTAVCRQLAEKKLMPENSRSYLRPGAVNRSFGNALAFLVRIGLIRSHFYVLEVRGRKSGKTISLPVNPLDLEGTRYLVCARGESNWVRNARTAGEVVLARAMRRRRYAVRELPLSMRPPILKAYLDRFASEVQHFFPVAKGSPVEAFKDLAPRYPVFELQPLD
jgi:hypothetical protein